MMDDKVYQGPLRFDELQQRVQMGELERISLNPDPYHSNPIGPHVDVKTWQQGATQPDQFKVQDPAFARNMTGPFDLNQ